MSEPDPTVGAVPGLLGGDAAWGAARIGGGVLRVIHPCGSRPRLPVAEGHRTSEQDLFGFLKESTHELDSVSVDLPRVIGIMVGRNGEKKQNPRLQEPAG